MKSEINKPTIIIDELKCKKNISEMSLKAKINKLNLRPHFKTHQSHQIGRWFMQEGIDRITVSSFDMAEYFSNDGWKDITVAFPANIREIDMINSLSKKINLNILISDTFTLSFLENNLRHQTGFYIKIDTGYHRSGIDYKNIAEIDNLIKMSYNSSNLKFKGFLTHAGNTYNTVDKEEVISIHNNNLCIMNDLKKRYKPEWPEIQISIGDTPSCSISDNFDGIDEIRPGNFVFYDLMQQNIGSCDFEDIAIVLACPVVSLDNNSNKIIILGGAIHLSKESMLNKNGEKIFGRIVRFNSNYSWESPEPDLYVNSISQEHGIINANKEFINNVQIGDIIGILPVHSCLTANLMARYTSLSGNIIDHFSSRK
ncbi:alanine racemase [Bacteroidota bacterium]